MSMHCCALGLSEAVSASSHSACKTLKGHFPPDFPVLGPTTEWISRGVTPWSWRALLISEEIHECHDHVPVHFFLGPSPPWLPPSGGYSCGMLHSWALGCLEMLRHRPISWNLAPLYRAWPEDMGSWAYWIVTSPSKLLCIFWKYWSFPQIPASSFGLRWCFLNLNWWNHECWSPLDPSWHFFKCCLAPFYPAMDTNETAASQSNTGMFCSMLPRLRHVVLVYGL